MLNVRTYAVESERYAGSAFLDSSHRYIAHNLYVVSVIIFQDFICVVSVLREFYRAPLRKPVTGNFNTVTISGKERFNISYSSNITVENLINYFRYILEYLSAEYKRLIVCRAVGNVKIVTSVSLILRINTVESK